VFSPLASAIRLSPEAEQTRRDQILLEVARKAARAGGQDPDTLTREELDCLLARAREEFSWASLADLEVAVLILK